MSNMFLFFNYEASPYKMLMDKTYSWFKIPIENLQWVPKEMFNLKKTKSIWYLQFFCVLDLFCKLINFSVVILVLTEGRKNSLSRNFVLA